jgi:putative toxin-antitoxin system antitoxin component (TIGR02293 family)
MRAHENKSPAASRALTRFRQFASKPAHGSHSYAFLLGIRRVEWPELLDMIEAGLPFNVFEQLRESTGLPADDIATWLQFAPRTLTRRKLQGRFGPDESDRILRAARVLGRALELFEGDRDAAVEWLTTPQLALGGVPPLDVARTDVGTREVENLIGRLEHGVFS